MAGSVSRVILIGHLGKDPEVKTVGENKMAVLSVATSKRWRDKSSGEKRERTSWHRVVVYQKNGAEFAEKYLKKGMHVCVEGSLDQREYEKDGEKRSITEVLVSAFDGSVQSLEKIGGGGERAPEPTPDDYGDMPY